MPFRKSNYYSLLQAEAIHLDGLPQTAGAPDGYGDLATTINRVNPQYAQLQSLISAGNAGIHLYGNSFANAGTFAYSFCTASGGRLYLVKNSGVGGLTSAQVLTKIESEGIESDAKILLYIEGTNDASQSVAASVHSDNMRAIAQYAIDRGVIPIMCVTAPIDTAASALVNQMALTDQLLSIDIPIPAYDLFARWVDPLDGTWLSGASSDGTHPTQLVYASSGIDLWNSIVNRLPCYIIPRLNAGNGLFGSNVLNYTDAGADGLPENWQVLSFTGQTYPAMQDYVFPFRGKRARLTSSQTASGGTLYRVLSKAGKFSDGDEILISGVFGVDAVSNARISIYVRPNNSGQPDKFIAAFCTVTLDTYIQAKFTVPAGTTDLRLFVRFDADSAGTHGGTIGYGCWDFYNLTTQTL